MDTPSKRAGLANVLILAGAGTAFVAVLGFLGAFAGSRSTIVLGTLLALGLGFAAAGVWLYRSN
jgi:hypothetical protein